MSLFTGAKRTFATYIDQGTVLNSAYLPQSPYRRAELGPRKTTPISSRSSHGVHFALQTRRPNVLMQLQCVKWPVIPISCCVPRRARCSRISRKAPSAGYVTTRWATSLFFDIFASHACLLGRGCYRLSMQARF